MNGFEAIYIIWMSQCLTVRELGKEKICSIIEGLLDLKSKEDGFMGQEEVTKEVSDRKSPHNLENTMDNRVTEAAAEPMSEDAWNLEKDELLKTHPGWFAAYQDGKRVALQPSLDRLAAALDKKLGSPRRPCEFYEIIGKPMIERGPSPRLRPARAEKQGVNNGKNSTKG